MNGDERTAFTLICFAFIALLISLVEHSWPALWLTMFLVFWAFYFMRRADQ